MRTISLKSCFMAVLTVCLLFSSPLIGNASQSTSSCGTITVEGDVMLTSTEDPSSVIEKIILTDGNGRTYTFDGCGSNQCSTDVSRIPEGTYHVTVITSTCSYNDTVFML